MPNWNTRDISFTPAWDLQAIQWLRAALPGIPVIAEANTWPILYGWGNRYAVYTGLPAVIGWDWHQRQQRMALPDSGVTARNRGAGAGLQHARSGRSPCDSQSIQG